MTLQPYSIRADSQTMEALGRIAEAMDRSRNWVINDALKTYIEDHAWLQEHLYIYSYSFFQYAISFLDSAKLYQVKKIFHQWYSRQLCGRF